MINTFYKKVEEASSRVGYNYSLQVKFHEKSNAFHKVWVVKVTPEKIVVQMANGTGDIVRFSPDGKEIGGDKVLKFPSVCIDSVKYYLIIPPTSEFMAPLIVSKDASALTGYKELMDAEIKTIACVAFCMKHHIPYNVSTQFLSSLSKRDVL